MSHQSDDAREVLRAIWAAQGESSADLDEDCGPTKSCKNMRDVSFDGLAEPGSDLTGAWRERLAREGKCKLGSQNWSGFQPLKLGPAVRVRSYQRPPRGRVGARPENSARSGHHLATMVHHVRPEP